MQIRWQQNSPSTISMELAPLPQSTVNKRGKHPTHEEAYLVQIKWPKTEHTNRCALHACEHTPTVKISAQVCISRHTYRQTVQNWNHLRLKNLLKCWDATKFGHCSMFFMSIQIQIAVTFFVRTQPAVPSAPAMCYLEKEQSQTPALKPQSLWRL